MFLSEFVGKLFVRFIGDFMNWNGVSMGFDEWEWDFNGI